MKQPLGAPAAWTITFLIFSNLFSCTVEAQQNVYSIRKEDSHVGFSIYKWMVIKEEGRFKEFNGTIVYDPASPSDTKIAVTVQAASIDSRNEQRDSALRSAEFFDAERYRTLSFTSTKVGARGIDTLLVSGNLTMKGITKAITIPVKVSDVHHVNKIGSLIGFETEFIVNRDDFNIAPGWSVIGNEATIHLLIGASAPSELSTR